MKKECYTKIVACLLLALYMYSRRDRNTQLKKKVSHKKKKEKFSLSFSSVFFLLFVGVLFFLVITSLIAVQFRPANEAPSQELKKIPKEVKKTLTQASSSATFRIPILMYHYVEYVVDKKDTIRQSLDTPPYILDEQLQTLKNANYTFLTAGDVAEILAGKKSLPSKPIVITFDDGHWDLYTDALPILEKYHVKATAYIISGFIGGSDFLSSSQLEKVIQSGLVEIGAHTVDHIALKDKLLPLVQYEVAQSKKSLEDTYHLHIVSFAYPSGSFDQQAINVVQTAGFETAVSTIPGVTQSEANQYFLYRLRPAYRTGDALLTFLQQNTFTSGEVRKHSSLVQNMP